MSIHAIALHLKKCKSVYTYIVFNKTTIVTCEPFWIVDFHIIFLYEQIWIV